MLRYVALAALLLVGLASPGRGDDEGESLDATLGVSVTEDTGHGLRMWPEDGQRMASENGDFVVRCQFNNTEAEIKWYEVPDEGVEAELVVPDVDIEVNPDTKSSTLTVPESRVRRGRYRCKVGGQVGEFSYESFFKLVPFPKSYMVMAQDDLKLFCRLRAGSQSDGTPQFSWFKKLESQPDSEGVPIKTNMSDTVDGEPHIKIIEVEEMVSMLKIEDARYSDRAIYGCHVENSYGQSETTQALVRVKDRLAALYPFLGIVAEVIVLCGIIFMCERRKTAKGEDANVGDDDDEDNNGSAPGHGQNSNVRQRHA